jgi:hypothetical protein
MVFRSYVPRPPLSEFVESLWFWQSDGAVEATSLRLPIETGCTRFVQSTPPNKFTLPRILLSMKKRKREAKMNRQK